jgi:hypothetical protein
MLLEEARKVFDLVAYANDRDYNECERFAQAFTEAFPAFMVYMPSGPEWRGKLARMRVDVNTQPTKVILNRIRYGSKGET